METYPGLAASPPAELAAKLTAALYRTPQSSSTSGAAGTPDRLPAGLCQQWPSQRRGRLLGRPADRGPVSGSCRTKPVVGNPRAAAFRPKSPRADGNVETSHGPPGRRSPSGPTPRPIDTRSQVRTRGPCRSWDRKDPAATGFGSLRRPVALAGSVRPITRGLGGGWKRPFRSGNKRSSIKRRRWSKPMHRGRRQRPISLPAGLPSSGCWPESRFRPVRLLLSCGL